jgi:hypothetical protein
LNKIKGFIIAHKRALIAIAIVLPLLIMGIMGQFPNTHVKQGKPKTVRVGSNDYTTESKVSGGGFEIVMTRSGEIITLAYKPSDEYKKPLVQICRYTPNAGAIIHYWRKYSDSEIRAGRKVAGTADRQVVSTSQDVFTDATDLLQQLSSKEGLESEQLLAFKKKLEDKIAGTKWK